MPTKLEAALQNLIGLHEKGGEMEKLLQKKPGGTYLVRGEYERVGKLFSVSTEKARKMVAFAQRYTSQELGDLVEECEVHSRSIGFDVVIRLLSIRDRNLRSKVQQEAIENGWTKEQVSHSMRKLRATGDYKLRGDNFLDPKGRGKPPKAIGSPQALLGQLSLDASKWHRIATLIKSEDKQSHSCVH